MHQSSLEEDRQPPGETLERKKEQIDVVVVVDEPALFTATKLETSRGIRREQSRMSKNEPWRRSSKLQEGKEREKVRDREKTRKRKRERVWKV